MKRKILFLCTGNTCRSPMAEGFFNKIATERGMDYEAKSAGLQADGGPANEKSIRAAEVLYGVDISTHQSRQVTAEMLINADAVVTMTVDQAELLKALLPEIRNKISSLTPEGVRDPFGGTEEDYLNCAGQIYQALAARTEGGAWN